MLTDFCFLVHLMSRRKSWAGHVASMGDEKCIQNVYRETEKKKPLGRPRSRWEDNIRIDFTAIGWDGVDWIFLAHDWDQ